MPNVTYGLLAPDQEPRWFDAYAELRTAWDGVQDKWHTVGVVYALSERICTLIRNPHGIHVVSTWDNDKGDLFAWAGVTYEQVFG